MRISREFHFDSAHMLPNHSGKCSRLHGHTYRMIVSIETLGTGSLEDQRQGESSEGMLMDFGTLDEIVQSAILNDWDHRFICKGDEWPALLPTAADRNVCIVNVRTTVENLSYIAAKEIGDEIQKRFKIPIAFQAIVSVELFEGLKNSATSEIGVLWPVGSIRS